MRKFGILETTFAKSASYKKQIEEAAKFIVQQPALSLADDTLKNMVINKCTSSLHTPMNLLFQHLTDTFKNIRELPFVHVFVTANNPPEIFSSDSITFDFNEAMANPPGILDGTVVNLTNSVRLKKTLASQEYIIDDILKIHGLCVRAALCQSYLKSNDKLWLTPKLCLFIIESYNMIIVNQIRQYLNVTDPYMLKKIAFLNCAFMAQMLNKESHSGLPELMYRLNLGMTTNDINNLLGELTEKGYDFKKKYFAQDLCEMYKALCGERFNAFNISQLFRLFTAGHVDKPFASIMLEYPPFWVYQLLMIGSGAKQPVYNNIFKNNNLLSKIGLFATDLNTTDTFIGSL